MKPSIWVRAICMMVTMAIMALLLPVSIVNAKKQESTSAKIEYRNNGSKSDEIIEIAVEKAHLSSEKSKDTYIVLEESTGEGTVQIVEKKITS